LGRECPESADFDTYTSDFDTQGIYSLREISKRDNAGAGKLPERVIAGASELPKRLNDQKGWKRLHYLQENFDHTYILIFLILIFFFKSI